MLIILIIVLLLVLVIWGVDVGLQNIAMAKQAQATIEVARASEVSSVGNVAVIMLTVLVIVLVLALAIYMVYRRFKNFEKVAGRQLTETHTPSLPASAPNFEQMSQLFMMKMMNDMLGANNKPPQQTQTQYLELPKEDDPIIWK